MSSYLYTVSKPFIFKGLSFGVGDSFDPEKMQCPAQRLRTLLSARLIVPGYAGAIEPPKEFKSELKANQKKAEETNKTPDEGDDSADDADEGENGKSEVSSKQSGRRNGRRN